jgi:hypothetical protein
MTNIFISVEAHHISASLAQLVERGTSNAEVTGSTPLGGMMFCSLSHDLRLWKVLWSVFFAMVWLSRFCWWLHGWRIRWSQLARGFVQHALCIRIYALPP